MRIAITGTTGRVGAALARHLGERHEVIPLPHSVCDFADSASLDAALANLECDVFINPAAITSLEACEENSRLAMKVNSAAPGKIALWAAERSVRMIHFSTDYVFAGDTTISLTENVSPRPINIYGRSKLAGERAVLTHPGNLVIRVSWVFGPEKPSFVDSIFDNALAGRPLSAVGDKFSRPTFTEDLCQWVESLLGTKIEGVLHACNPGEAVSWQGLAQAVVREMTARGVISTLPEIEALKLDEVKAFLAQRPRFSAMDTRKLASLLGGALRPWPEAISEYVRERCLRMVSK